MADPRQFRPIPAIPNVPAGVNPDLRHFLTSVRDALTVRAGGSKNELDRAVTVRELVDTGIVVASGRRLLPATEGKPPTDWDKFESDLDDMAEEVEELFTNAGVNAIPIHNGTDFGGEYQGQIIFNTVDNKLYRWTGTEWTAAVPAVDVIGQLTNEQLADIAAAKIVGQLTNAQIAGIDAAKITTGQLTDAQIASVATAKLTGQITETQISSGAISTPKLEAGAITAAKLAAGSVIAGKIASDAVTAATIEAGAVTSAKILAGAITAGKLSTGAVYADNIAAGQIWSSKIAAGAITAGKIATNAVTAVKIQAGAIETDKLAANSITGDKIVANTITGGLIAAAGIITTAAQITNGVITNAKIENGAITTAKIGDLAVDTLQIADDAITVPVAGSISSYSNVPTSPVQIGSLTVSLGTATLKRVLIMGSLMATGGSTGDGVTLRAAVYVDGKSNNILSGGAYTFPNSGGATIYFARMVTIATAQSSVTVRIYAEREGVSSTINVLRGTYLVLGVKR
ncbi:hypothetical protein [Kineobactrum salinum]|uniref:DUF1983 domain-containing protein n=1 Tax=Kineobactrum salinum TaxID=2708301 RepID=A0A6C0U773_9GAMM|nr:hypothetical protein [Kineobactrum salinum]QIB67179.1 hypothetical protein G3T16_18985 [Kineobactrum salinum]